ncbi:MAG: MFS transporter [Thaumarchaeota archaeon]|nr:MFS transporter [Nitrososphaerota archaeon]
MKIGAVYAYSAVVFASIGLGATLPMIPVLGRNLGASYAELGYIGTATYIPYILATLIYTRIADRLSRLRMFIAAMICNTITLTSLSTVNSVTSLVATVAFQGMAQGLYWASSETFILSRSPENRLTSASRFVFLTSLGFFLGPAAGGFATEFLGFGALFIMAASAFLTGGILLILHATRMSQTPKLEPKVPKTEPKVSGRTFLPALIMIVSPYMVLSVALSILPGYLRSFGTSSAQIGTMYAIFFAARLLGSLSSSRLSRLGERKTLLAASTLMTVAFLGIASSQETLLMTPLMALLGLGLGASIPIAMHATTKAFPDGRLGAAMGAFETVYGATSAITPFIAGLLAETIAPTAPYFLIGLVSLVAIASVLSRKSVSPVH